jgi:hypothetical protein
MKTTVEISDELLTQAREVAARDGLTLRALIEAGLRDQIAKRRRPARFSLRDASVGGKGMTPEYRDAGWDRIRDAAYGSG